jgi:hypothetical protein
MTNSSEDFPDIPQEKLDDVFFADIDEEEAPAGVRHDPNYIRFSPPEEDDEEDDDPYEEIIELHSAPENIPFGATGPGPEGARQSREYQRHKAEIEALVEEAYNKGFQDGAKSVSAENTTENSGLVEGVSGILAQLEQHRLSVPAHRSSRSAKISRIAMDRTRRRF